MLNFDSDSKIEVNEAFYDGTNLGFKIRGTTQT
jgi:hypothetical protein